MPPRRPPAVLEGLESEVLRLEGELAYADRVMAHLFEERRRARQQFDLSDVPAVVLSLNRQLDAERRYRAEAFRAGYRAGLAARDADALPDRLVLDLDD